MTSKIFTKERVASLVVLGVLVVFRSKFQELANEFLVDPFLSECKSDWVTNLIFIVLSFGILYRVGERVKKNYLPSWDSFALITVISGIYSYYRFADDARDIWDFTGFYDLNQLKYADIVFVWFAGELCVILNSRMRSVSEEPRPLSFSLDEPIHELDDDELDRKQDARLLAQRIEQTQGQYSFSVAINGPWGTGKTSFMNLIKKYLESSDDVIVMDFNPWLGQDSHLITRDFFDSLRSKLKPYSSVIDEELETYSNQFADVEGGWLSKSFKSLITLFRSRSLKEQFDSINTTLEKIDKQVVVFIDDLDRLTDLEIHSVLRLIRNTADFSKLKYVVAFDRSYVEKAIESMNVTNHVSYLEKIFLHSHPLSPVKSEYVLDELEADMISRFPSQEADITYALKDRYKPVSEVAELIVTVRDVKRFVNQFAVDFEFVESEVFFPEYLRIQLLKFKFNSVYQLLDTKRDEFLEIPAGHSSWIEDKVGYQLKRVSGSNHGTDYMLKHYLIDNSSLLNVGKADIPMIMDLVENLFVATKYSSRGKTNHLSISYPFNYERYFRNRIFEYNLSEKEFNHMLSLPLVQMQEQIVRWVNDGKKLSVVRRFTDERSEKCEDRVGFEKLIKAICFLAKYKKPKYEGYQIGYYDRDLATKLSDYKGAITKKFYDGNPEQYKEFVRSLFTGAESPYTFESGFLAQVNQNQMDFPLSLEEVWEILVSYLKSYLDSVTVLDNYCWDLYHKCDTSVREEKAGSAFTIRTPKNPEAIKIFVEFILQHGLDDFLFQVVRVEPFDQQKYSVSDIILDLFGSYAAFDEVLGKQDAESHPYVKEFREFLKIFLENGAKSHVSFDFKVIPVHKKIQER